MYVRRPCLRPTLPPPLPPLLPPFSPSLLLFLPPPLPPSLSPVCMYATILHVCLQAVVQAMRIIDPPLELEDEANEVHRRYIEEEATATDFDYPPVSRPLRLCKLSLFTLYYSYTAHVWIAVLRGGSWRIWSADGRNCCTTCSGQFH